MLLGTIKEVTIGPTSLMAIVTFQFTRELNIHFVILLTFLTGLVQLIMGVLRLGFLVDFISTPVVSGFTSATSFIVIVAQLKHLGGLRFQVRGFLNRLHALWTHLPEVNPGDAILGLASIVFLLALKRLGTVRLAAKERPDAATSWQTTAGRVLWFLSISRNALCIFLAALVAKVLSHFSEDEEVPFAIVGDIVPGLPTLALPPFHTTIGNRTYTFPDMVSELGVGIIIVPLVGVLGNVAIAKAFASDQTMDATQEMVALAGCNLVGSLVQAMPVCGAFTRSAVSHASGVRTPMVGLYTTTLVVLALAFLTPYFYFIPRATLAAVLICAVAFLIDASIVPQLWRTSKRDLVTLLVTFSACLCFGVEVGLVLGMALDLTRLLHVWARPRLTITICCEGGGEYILVRPSLGLLFPGVDTLRQLVDEAGLHEGQGTLPVVVDCAPILAMDFTGVKAFEALVRDFEKRGQQLLFLEVDPDVRDLLRRAGLYNSISFCEEEDDLPSMMFGERLRTASNQDADDARSSLAACEWGVDGKVQRGDGDASSTATAGVTASSATTPAGPRCSI
ncbi:sodium-independent sulfate anion transporter-like isoform X2 [Thrips palmi]|nr:sodium-independent sulfate anion transporter-like isoform X2 [Thrips palmi]XP_034248095.1 sodium-independent sulfate anion transporter-like isoform X2 [Thrips palmi]